MAGRRNFLRIHRFSGLLSGLFILIMSVSGSILVFQDELDRLYYPPLTVRAQSPIQSLDSCYDQIRKVYPAAQIGNCEITHSRQMSFVFTIYDSTLQPQGGPTRVFLHPQTGQVQKTLSANKTLPALVGQLHNSLFLGKTGEWLLGFFSLLFILSLVTGGILYYKQIVPVLLFRKRLYRKNNLHQIIGTWALLFNLMIAVTGFWMQRYVFRQSFYQTTSFTRVIRASEPLGFSLDSALMRLRTSYPDFTAYVIYFPQKKGGMSFIYGSRRSNSFIHSKKLADAIYLDSAGKLAGTAFVNEIDHASRYDIINSQVHFGQYGGLPVKIIYSVLGLTGSMLSITGFLLWLRRRQRRANV